MRRIRPLPYEGEFWICWLTGLAIFLILAWWCHGHYFLPFDKTPMVWVQDLYPYGWSDDFFRAVNRMGSPAVISVVIVVTSALLVARRMFIEAALLLGAVAVRGLQLAAREIVYRPMSFDNPPDPVEVYPGPNSFPSGHVVAEVVVYGLIFIYAQRLIRWWPAVWAVRAACVFIIVAGGPARMYTGSHWPSDVIGGLLLGGLYLALAWRIIEAVRDWRAQRDEEQIAIATRAEALHTHAAHVPDASAVAPEPAQTR